MPVFHIKATTHDEQTLVRAFDATSVDEALTMAERADAGVRTAEYCHIPASIAILEHAAAILNAKPFCWQTSVEYPGYLLIGITDADSSDRYYETGFANDMVTVDQMTADGENVKSACTMLRSNEADGYRMAVHVAVAIDLMEHEGSAQ